MRIAYKRQMLLILLFLPQLLNIDCMKKTNEPDPSEDHQEYSFDHSNKLLKASMQYNIKGIRTALSSGANPDHSDANGTTSLHFALMKFRQNDIMVVRNAVNILLENGSSVDLTDGRGVTPVHLALITEDSDIQASVIHRMRATHYQLIGWNYYEIGVLFNYINDMVAELLREKGISIREENRVKQHIIEKLRENDPDLSRILDDDRSLATITGPWGRNLLHLSLVYDADIASYLIAKQEGINAKDINGNTPLHFAVFEHEDLAVRIIKNTNVDINIVNNKGRTVLHEIALLSRNDNSLVELVIEKGVDINAQDIEGNTALHHAIEMNCFELVSLLVRKGATIDVQNQKGKTAKDVALERMEDDPNIMNRVLELLSDSEPK
jgi:ankyrin repeat protein